MYVSRYLYLDLQLYLYFYSGRNCVCLSFVFGEFVARCFHGCAGAGKFERLVREFLLREIFGFPTRCSKVSWQAGRLRCRGPTSPQLRQPPVVASRRPRVSQQSMRDNCCCCCCEQSDWERESESAFLEWHEDDLVIRDHRRVIIGVVGAECALGGGMMRLPSPSLTSPGDQNPGEKYWVMFIQATK